MKRQINYDLCRICACLMVMVSHTSGVLYQYCPIGSDVFTATNIISTAVRGSVCVFFMISGALLLSRDTLDTWRLLKKNVVHIMFLFFVWSFVYALGNRISEGNFAFDQSFFIQVATGHYHMWFLPALTICYLFIPPVHSAIHGKKLDPRYLLMLAFIFSLLWRNLNLTPKPAYVLNKFTVTFGLEWFPALGYCIWGWWLSTKEMPKKTLWVATVVFILCTLIASVGNEWYSRQSGLADGWLFHYLSIPSFIQATSMFCFFSALKEHEFKREKLIFTLSDCTLGVYLMHPVFINIFGRLHIGVTAEHPVSSVIGFTLFLAAFCFTLTYIGKKIPIVRKFIS